MQVRGHPGNSRKQVGNKQYTSLSSRIFFELSQEQIDHLIFSIYFFGKVDRANENIDPELHFAPKNSPRSLGENHFSYRDVRIPDSPIFDELLRILMRASRRSFFVKIELPAYISIFYSAFVRISSTCLFFFVFVRPSRFCPSFITY